MKIVPYSEIHREEILELILNIQNKEYGIEITASDQPDLQNIKGFYQKNNGNFWVALADNKVIGTISLLDIGSEKAALRKMFVEKNYRGSQHGISKALLNTMLSWAGEKSLKSIYLGTTSKFLAAHKFYEKNGFQQVSQHELPESFPIMAVDTVFYKCNI